MSKETIIAIAKFQCHYLEQLYNNVPEDKLYERQLQGYNSAGWVMGHLAVEADSVLHHLKIRKLPKLKGWYQWFKNTQGKITTLEGLPGKAELLKEFKEANTVLIEAYNTLPVGDRNSSHPSIIIGQRLPNLDSWVTHHITTHISIHCGNFAVWKKLVGLNVEGF